jgi:ribosomal-protein-alanine N-acetyltransferase
MVAPRFSLSFLLFPTRGINLGRGPARPMQPIPTIPALAFRRFTEQDALTMVSWRYPEPYAAYDLDPWDRDVFAALLRPEHQYHAILREGGLAGFFCLGEDARVPGWPYDNTALDFGMGLRPDLTGTGSGLLYFAAILSYLDRRHPGASLRATVAGWNQRAIRLSLRAGFREIARFQGARSPRTEYVVLLRDPAPGQPGPAAGP